LQPCREYQNLTRHRRYPRASSEMRLDCCAVYTPNGERGVHDRLHRRSYATLQDRSLLRGCREDLMKSVDVAARQKTRSPALLLVPLAPRTATPPLRLRRCAAGPLGVKTRMPPECSHCCKSPKLPGANFSAVEKSDRRPPLDVASITLPRSPASLSSGDEVPHIFTRKSRVQPKEILIASAKRLLQQNRHFRRIAAMHNFGSYRRCSGHAESVGSGLI
jgi:hypothetical protein